MLCDAIDECAAKTVSALQSLSTNHDPPPPAFQLTHSFDKFVQFDNLNEKFEQFKAIAI
jgi:hypothetical protein